MALLRLRHVKRRSYEAKKHVKRLLSAFKKHRTNYDDVNALWYTVEIIQTKQKELEVKKIEAVQSVFDGAITYTEEVFATATENLKNKKNVHHERSLYLITQLDLA
ncbi:hypothetical protein RclHR1_20070004 [Rhizophagus clarus]|uniref:Uncharacterized protein n=1 Tax=Rhizophagus clarus TaxID=94130 RepID=A0A2Z6QQT1_9GLOM|nr:hypothetical protein RclHR1_20070004 [Rhizophagus clarus]